MPLLGSLGTIGRVLLVASVVVYLFSEISTLSGAGISGYYDGTSSAQFNAPWGIAVNSLGDVYIGDQTNNRIRKINPSTGVVTTFAGNGTTTFADGTGTNATLFSPLGIAFDSSGIMYVADYNNQRIRKITPAGVVTTFAGNGTVSTVDGTGTNATFFNPAAVAVNSAGVVYVVQSSNYIRRITPEGVVTILAGNGTASFADGTGTNARFSAVQTIALDSTGTLYVGDYNNHRIRRITSAGVVTTFAGNGTAGGTDGTGTNATFNGPTGIAFDSSGIMYVVDNNTHRIRKITPAGVVTTFAGGSQGSADGTGTNAQFNFPIGIAINSTGIIYIVDNNTHRIRKITPAGVVTTLAGSGVAGFIDSVQNGAVSGALLNLPRAVAVDSSSTMYVADTTNHRIRKITSTGVVTTLAGSGTAQFADGTGTGASFNSPQGISVDSAGNVYVGDTLNNRVRKITPSGVVTTLAGSGTAQFADGTGTGASFNNPYGVTVDSEGIVYVVDKLNYRVRKITMTADIISTLASGFNSPIGVAVDSTGNVYMSDINAYKVYKITPLGVSTVLAGLGPGSSDGNGTNASFNFPQGLTIDQSGNLYLTELGNCRIRKITPSGDVSTFAGSTFGYQDGTGTNAKFDQPNGIAIISDGTLYVSDTNNHRIRKITSAGVVTTLAGSGTGTFADGTGAGASFKQPAGLAVDSVGNVYVADNQNHRIRKISSAGVVSTLAGSGTAQFANGTGTSASFSAPSGIAVDSLGNVYVGDQGNARIRKITPAGVVTTFAGTGSYTFTDGTVSTATFNGLAGFAFDSSGNLYVGDTNIGRVRKITQAGVVTTLAGNGTAQYLEGTGTGARFLDPFGIVVNSAGTMMYVTDSNYIRKITSAGVTTFIAGQATAGSANATGVSASFNGPREIALLAAGTSVYVADTGNHSIRRVTTDFGVTTKYSGVGSAGFRETPVANVQYNTPSGIAVNSAGLVYVADTNNNRIRTIAAGADNTGTVTTVVGTSTAGYSDGGGWFNSPFGVATDWDGTVYVADTINNRIRKITPAGVVTSLAGSGAGTFADGTGTSASFSQPRGVALGSDGTVYVADTTNNRIRRITFDGIVTIVAGNAQGSTNGTGTSATLNAPNAITVNSSDIMYVADTGNHRIRAITQARVVTTFAGTTQGFQDGVGTNARFDTPRGIVADIYGNLYVADTNNHRIRRISSDGTVTTLAGSTAGYADATGTNAQFNFPTHLSIDTLGTLYVADQTNNRVRTIQTSTGVVSTLAGNGLAGFTSSQFNSPFGITVERFRNAYVADTSNHSIRKIPNAYTLPVNDNVVTTLAGDGTASFLDGNGIGARFNYPTALVVDSFKNVYIADRDNHRIRKLSPTGDVTTFAGSGSPGSADGTGISASFYLPNSIVIDSLGNLYVADRYTYRIRQITPAAVVTTYAGTTFGYLDGQGTAARFSESFGIAIDSARNIYVADTNNHRIRKISSTALVTTLAGSGTAQFADGTGTSASFNLPYGVVVDLVGNVYVSDYGNQRIRKITPAGVVTTFAGNGTTGSTNGTGTNATFANPYGLTIDLDGNLYVADTVSFGIRKITPTGVVTTVAGSGVTGAFADGIGTNARFNQPAGVTIDTYGNLYVADTINQRIRKIGSGTNQLPLNQGVVTTIAGNGGTTFTDGTGTNAQFNNPYGIAVDSTGNIYVADSANNCIRKITPAGVVTTIAGNGGTTFADGTGTNATFNSPAGLAVDSAGNLYVGDRSNHLIRRITPAGVVTTLAGRNGSLGFQDGTGTNAIFYQPRGVAVDSAGNVYVADWSNYRIRKITPAGVVTTLAGNGSAGPYIDGTGTSAGFYLPKGVAVDLTGNVYVVDTNNLIRKITPTGVVTTLAGQTTPGSTDGTGTNATFNNPYGVAVDSAGTVYVADRNNHLIRRITSSGVVTTLAGNGTTTFADGTGTNASFNQPLGVAVDSGGIVYVGDTSNHRIRKVQ